MNHGQKLMVLRLQLYTAVQELKGKDLDEYFELLHEIVDAEEHHKRLSDPLKTPIRNYRKKPIVIEAVQWNHHGDHPKVERYGASTVDQYPKYGECGFIKTLEGNMHVIPGDWIIKGVKGEYYNCKPDVFKETYEEVVCTQSDATKKPANPKSSS